MTMWAKLLGAMLCLCPMTAAAEWHEASTKHFVVYSDNRPDKVAAFADRLERFDKVLRMFRDVPDGDVGPANRVTVYVVPGGQSEIARLSGQENVAGFYVPRSGGSVAFVPRRMSGGKYDLDAEAVLFHEYTHHFMLTTWAEAAFPAWFVEGFAEFHATTDIRDDGSALIGKSPLYRAYGLIAPNPMPVARLLAAQPVKQTAEQVDAFYGRGWLLTHFLTFETAREGQLGQYIRSINAGQTPEKSAEAFGDTDALNREVNRYVRQRTLPAITIKADGIAVAPPTVRALGAGEAAMMKVRIQSKRGVSRKAALALLPQARRAAAPFPNDAGAQVALAEAEYDAGFYKEAEAAANRAAAADPKLADALVYRGMAQMALAVEAKVTDPARWRGIRRAFLAANAIDHDDPEPLMLYFQSFINAGQDPTANAKAAIVRAHELGPQDGGVRLTAATVLMRDGKGDEARRMLRPIAYAPHGAELAAFAAELIAAYDAGGTKAAIARIDRSGDPAAAKKTGGEAADEPAKGKAGATAG